MKEELARFLAARGKLLAGAVIAATVLPSLLLRGLRIDNSIEVWLDRKGPAYRAYRNFLERYGSDEFIAIALTGRDIFSPAALESIGRLTDDLAVIDGVEHVESVSEVRRQFFREGEENEFREEILSSPFYRNLLISTDGKVAGLFAFIGGGGGAERRRRVCLAVKETALKRGQEGWEVHLAGPPLMNAELDRASERDAMRFLPIAVAAAALALLVIFRSAGGVAAPMATVAIAVIWTMGLVAVRGTTLDMVMVAVPPLILVLSLSHSIHLLTRYRILVRRGLPPREACAAAVSELMLPCALAAVTTAIGFSSLALSRMGPVAHFGLYSAGGIMISLAVAFLVMPGLMQISGVPASGEKRAAAMPRYLERLFRFDRRRAGAIVTFSLLLLVLSLVSIRFVRTESNVLHFFPAGSAIRGHYRFISERLTGPYSVEVEVTSEGPITESFGGIDAVQERLEAHPHVARVISPLDFVKKVNQLLHDGDPLGYRLPPTGNDVRHFLSSIPPSLAARLKHFYLPEERSIRLSLMAIPMSSPDFYALMDFVRGSLRSLPAGCRATVTGVVPLLNDVQRELVRTQVRSFSLALGAVAVILLIVIRPLRRGAAAILPNVLPVALTFGIMALWRIPLDAATIMIASIAIGIAVDDTIHFMIRYNAERAAGAGRDGALRAAFEKAGAAMVRTSAVAFIGFMVLTAAGFTPVRYFGLLTAVAMATALLGDIVFLPALLSVMRRES